MDIFAFIAGVGLLVFIILLTVRSPKLGKIEVKGKTDYVIDNAMSGLNEFLRRHPYAIIHIYRSNEFSIRIRIIDNYFLGIIKAERYNYVWKYLNDLPDYVLNEISFLVLITPEEFATSELNSYFENQGLSM